MSGIKLRKDTEQSLVEALKQGRQEVISQLYDAYAPVLMGMITRIVKDTEVAEEVLQETFTAIWSRINSYDSSSSPFLTWIIYIARDFALQSVKDGRGYAFSSNGQVNGNNSTSNEADAALKLDGSLNSKLGAEEKETLELVYLKGCTCTEAAEKLGLTEQQLKARLKKAFTQLKAERSE